MTKITIVEDDATICNMYALKFRHAEFIVSTAKDGYEGLKVIKKEAPDMILLDLRMPRMGGDEMLRELRGSEWGQEIPVIILTNISKDEAPRTLWHLGISDFIVKSHSTPQKVLDCVQKVLASNV